MENCLLRCAQFRIDTKVMAGVGIAIVAWKIA
jgi:hypothetical protein